MALGINMAGEKESLSLRIAQTEGAKLWLQVVTELKNRGTISSSPAWMGSRAFLRRLRRITHKRQCSCVWCTWCTWCTWCARA
ncbi:hypothetical protein B9Z47_12645 [Limnohabitans sp. 2KL-1]|nr:hypothetical protein B9Z47_12645 [Limnohabitans sp. 2KL-1]